MRKMIGALAVAAMFASGATLMAGGLKPCYIHSEESSDGQTNTSVVWTNGGGHASHVADIPLGSYATYAECLAAATT